VATRKEDQNKEVLSSGAGLAADINVETHGELGEDESAIEARGYWEGVWLRFKRDRLALCAGIFIVLFILTAFFGGPIAEHFLGHGPNDLIPGGVTQDKFLPVGPWTHVTGPDGKPTLLILGADSTLGRDEFLRLLYGARTSFEVALGATALGVGLGVILGSLAGYFGGVTDTVVSRLTEVIMAFPVLLFVIALSGTIGPRLDSITFGFLKPGIVTLVLILGLFSWFYPARIIRGLVLSLREKEFIEAARMVGSSDWRIIRSHLVPHLVAPIIVLSTITGATMCGSRCERMMRRSLAPTMRAASMNSFSRSERTRPRMMRAG